MTSSVKKVIPISFTIKNYKYRSNSVVEFRSFDSATQIKPYYHTDIVASVLYKIMPCVLALIGYWYRMVIAL